MCGEIYHQLKQILKDRNLSTAVGDEGGFAPDVKDAWEVLELMAQACEKAGYQPGRDVCFAMDAAASELYMEEEKAYYFPGESSMAGEKIIRTAEELTGYYRQLQEKYPIVSIEDGLCEEDWEGWKMMSQSLGDKLQLVGDDLFVTNVKRIQKGIDMGSRKCGIDKSKSDWYPYRGYGCSIHDTKSRMERCCVPPFRRE